MAAALYTTRADPTTNIGSSYSPALMAELDYGDERYPSISSSASRQNQRSSILGIGSGGKSGFSPTNDDSMMRRSAPTSQLPARPAGARPATSDSQIRTTSLETQQRPSSRSTATDQQSAQSGLRSQYQESSRSAVSYSLPAAGNRRVVERYSLDGTTEQAKGARDPDSGTQNAEKADEEGLENTPQPSPPSALPSEPVAALPPSAPRHPSLPAAGIGANPNNVNADYVPPIMPLSASPTYSPPISSRPRAYPQQPTYITQGLSVQPMDPIFSNGPPPPQEEVCIECAMRDQDMADVDVTSPGVWDRESDVLYQELIEREAEEAEAGIIRSEDHSRPTSKGGALTERNLKIWLTLNPREPAARQQTLRSYLKSQRTLLVAEAVAHSRAVQEAKQLDSRVKDTYSKLRSSAYDPTTSASYVDETGGVRIKAPQSPLPWSTHSRSGSRDVTLLENGMIVEHVDVRKEEKQAKERRKKEERQMRKSSRSSAIDLTSLASTPTLSPLSDSGFRPASTHSVNTYGRPMSVLTAPLDGRPSIPRAQSQASLDMYSLSSASPRRSRFFGTFADRWRSQDSLAPSGISGMSGSMMDMHLALQREAYLQGPVDLNNTPRRSQLWNVTDLHLTESRQSRASEEKGTKKKKGLAKIWQLVTNKKSGKRNSSQDDQQWPDTTEDNSPLAPPPPMPFLMNHRLNGNRHKSTPSLPSSARVATSAPGMSPPTAPSSILPSPISSRPSGHDADIVGIRKNSDDQEPVHEDDTIGKKNNYMQPISSDWESRNSPPNGSISPPPTAPKISREKSLPPLPGDVSSQPESRQRLPFGAEHPLPPPGTAPAHDFLPPGAGYRSLDARRQSFNGLVNRPNVSSMYGMPTSRTMNGYDNPYEFGTSRHSLQFYDQRPSTPNTKRKSKFGFASLLGKKSTPAKEAPVAHQFPAMNAWSDPDDTLPHDYTPTNSRYSTYNAGSRSSRKVLEEKVPQDPQFIAYRYPSETQNLDLLR